MTATSDAPPRAIAGRMTFGDALIRLLAAYGVDTVFGIPGTHTLELIRPLRDAPIQLIQARHEQGAGFMADGYARISGRPGVCLLISGPGVLNAATPIAQAYSDSIPMLVLSSVAKTSDLSTPRGNIHELPCQQATMTTFTAFSATAREIGELPELFAKSFAVFNEERPRPVHIQIPLDVAETSGICDTSRRTSRYREPADAPTIDRAVDLLGQSSRPIILAGGGTLDCTGEVIALAEQLAAPVLTTIAAKGVIPDDHPLALGAPLTEPAGRTFLARADVVVAVGTELAASDNWVDRLEIPGSLIRIDIDRGAAFDNYPADVALDGDAGTTLRRLIDKLPGAGPDRRRATERQIRIDRDTVRQSVNGLQAKHVAVLNAIRQGLGRDGFLAADMTQPAYTANVHFPCYAPRRYFYPVGLSTLGFALPVAIGARLARPNVPGAVLIGDGGFLFTATELATAVDLGIGLAVVIWNNHGLAQIRMHMERLGIAALGVSGRNPDFTALARAFGCLALRPESLEEITAAVAGSRDKSVPTIIEIRDEDRYLP